MLKFSVIIPVYNKWELTCACLKSLREHTPGSDFEVIVVDNASSDETAQELPRLGEQLFNSNFTSIRNPENKNFAGACNQGAKIAKSEILFFLNNDTLLTPNWDSPLLETLNSDPSIGAVGPILLYPDNTVQHIGGATWPNGNVGHFYSHFSSTHPVVKQKRFLGIITAAALMLRAKDFFAVGAFHEGYINGFEDVELSYHLRQLGLKLTVVPNSLIYHLESQSPGRGKYERYNSSLLLKRCPEITKPDLHHFMIADGFMPFLSLTLTLRCDLSTQRELELTQQAVQCKNHKEHWDLLLQEPYWDNGYTQLADKLIAVQDHELALQVLNSQLGFFGITEKRLIKMLSLAKLLDNQQAIESILEVLGNHREYLAETQIIANIYYFIEEQALKYQDVELKSMLKVWRKQYGAQFLAKKY